MTKDVKIPKNILIALLLIVVIGAILRFYRLPEMSQFEFDQEYAANFAYSVLRVYPIQLIGQGLSVQGLFMGPLYFYYLVPFFALTNLHPIGGAIGSVFLGLFTILVYFWVGRALFGNQIGLALAFLRATLNLYISTDWLVTPAFSSDLVVLLTWYCFYRYWQGQTIFIIPAFFLFGLYTSFHPILFPFYFVFTIMVLIKRKLPNLKNFMLAIIAGLIPILPLIKFEIDHSFLELKLLTTMSSENITHEARDLPRLIKFLYTELTGPLSNLTSDYRLPWITPISFIMLILILVLIFKKSGFWKERFHAVMLGVSIATFTTYYFILPTHVPEYYFLPIHVLCLIYLVGSLTLLPKHYQKKTISVIFLIIFIWNLKILNERWNDPHLKNLAQKDTVVKEIVNRQPKDSVFFVSYMMAYGANTGYPYLFKIYERIPSKDVVRPIYNIVYPKDSIPDKYDLTSGNIGLLLPD